MNVKQSLAKIATLPALAVLAVSTAVSSAHAAGAAPTGAAAAITQYSDDVTTTVGLVIAAGIAVWGAFKLGRKFGWL